MRRKITTKKIIMWQNSRNQKLEMWQNTKTKNYKKIQKKKLEMWKTQNSECDIPQQLKCD